MLACLYCKNEQFPIGKGSKEHVILSALGGKKSSRNVCCKTCNNRLGNEIDEALANNFNFISNMLGITTGRGKPAPTLKRAFQNNEANFDLGPVANASLSKAVVRQERNEDIGEVKISIEARDKESALKLLNQILKKYGKSTEDYDTLPAKLVKKPIPAIPQSLNIGSPEQLRSVAKMLITYLATMTNPENIRGKPFEKVVEYINSGNEDFDEIEYDFVTKLPSDPFLHKINHRIFIFASSKKRIVLGVIELFGHLRWSVPLTSNWNGPDIAKAYVVNPLDGTSAEELLELRLNIFENLGERVTSPSQIKVAVEGILQATYERQRDVRFSEISRKAVQKYRADNASVTVGEDILSGSSHEITEEMMRLILRLESEEDIDLKE